MKSIPLILALVLAASSGASAQFSSGSTGAFGPIAVAAGNSQQVPLPPNGVINATTVSVANGATLSFTKNALNTPVILLATGDIVIDGLVDVSGAPSSGIAGAAGGPGGFAGGDAASNLLRSSPGLGPGGGRVSTGGSYGGRNCFGDVREYGSSLLVPVVGGSGGGGVAGAGGGGGGGGGILIASSTQVVVNGEVRARGGNSALNNGHNNGGSGGGVRIVAPTVSGAGLLDAHGGSCGGVGRIRVDTIDLNTIAFNAQPSSAMSVGSFLKARLDEPAPRLDLISVAGRAITEGTAEEVFFELPFDAPNQNLPVTVRGRGFTIGREVTIEIVLTPQSGTQTLDGVIDAKQQTLTVDSDPFEATISFDFPQNIVTRVHAWTR